MMDESEFKRRALRLVDLFLAEYHRAERECGVTVPMEIIIHFGDGEEVREA